MAIPGVDLAGKGAIVTGSSRGIGRAIAEALAAQGANVVISSRTQEACDEVAADINRRTGGGGRRSNRREHRHKDRCRTPGRAGARGAGLYRHPGL